MTTTTTVHVVTGGSKGIGFAVVKELSARPNTTVIATARVPSKASKLLALIKTHPNVHVVAYDAAKRGDSKQLAEVTAQIVDGVDVLHANAGIFEGMLPFLETPSSVYERHMAVNFLAVIDLVQDFYPLLKKHDTRKIILTSSVAGSMGGYAPVPLSAYGSSKAALNYIAKVISSDLAADKFICVAIHPGGVATEGSLDFIDRFEEVRPDITEGFRGALIQPEESAKQQLKLIDELTPESNGKFLNLDGTELPY